MGPKSRGDEKASNESDLGSLAYGSLDGLQSRVTAADPENIWSFDGLKSSGNFGGFSLRLLDYDGHALAAIPIDSDRLDVSKAKLAPGVFLVENPG